MAVEHRQLAAQHRAASEALQAAEARACAGIAADDRDISPFAHRGDIRSVSPLKEEFRSYGGGDETRHTVGVTIVFQAVPGLTAQWLQRIVDCHLARNAAIGHDVAGVEMAYCPLTVRGVTATVRPLADGFGLDVRTDDAAALEQVSRRAQALVAGR